VQVFSSFIENRKKEKVFPATVLKFRCLVIGVFSKEIGERYSKSITEHNRQALLRRNVQNNQVKLMAFCKCFFTLKFGGVPTKRNIINLKI